MRTNILLQGHGCVQFAANDPIFTLANRVNMLKCFPQQEFDEGLSSNITSNDVTNLLLN